MGTEDGDGVIAGMRDGNGVTRGIGSFGAAGDGLGARDGDRGNADKDGVARGNGD